MREIWSFSTADAAAATHEAEATTHRPDTDPRPAHIHALREATTMGLYLAIADIRDHGHSHHFTRADDTNATSYQSMQQSGLRWNRPTISAL